MGRDRLPDLLKKNGSWHSSLDEVIIIKEYTERELRQIENIDNFLIQYSNIKIKLDTLKSNLEAMNRMTQQSNVAHFNENDLETLRDENLKLASNLMTIFNHIQINLPEFNNFTIEARMQRCLYYGLQKHFNILWHENEAFLVNYEKKVKKQLLHQCKILNWDATEEEVDDIIANKQTHLFIDNILQDTENERRKLRDLIDTCSELRKLEKSIEDVHSLFLRIQNLVMEQGESIQRIEHHATQASIHVDKSEKLTLNAKNLQKKTRKKKIWLIGILSAFLLILILYLFI